MVLSSLQRNKYHQLKVLVLLGADVSEEDTLIVFGVFFFYIQWICALEIN